MLMLSNKASNEGEMIEFNGTFQYIAQTCCVHKNYMTRNKCCNNKNIYYLVEFFCINSRLGEYQKILQKHNAQRKVEKDEKGTENEDSTQNMERNKFPTCSEDGNMMTQDNNTNQVRSDEEETIRPKIDLSHLPHPKKCDSRTS